MSEITVEPGEIQGTIDQYSADDPAQFMRENRVKITLSGDPSLEFSSDTDPLPIKLEYGVTLDMNGRDFHVREDSDVFHMDQFVWMFNGTIKYDEVGQSYSSDVLSWDTTNSNYETGGGANSEGGIVRNINTLGAEGNSGRVMYWRVDTNELAGWIIADGKYVNCGDAWLRGENMTGGRWLNGNKWTGATVIGGKTQIDLYSDGHQNGGTNDRYPINGNYWSGSFKPNSNSEWLFNATGGLISGNHFDLHSFPDASGYSEGVCMLENPIELGGVQNNLFVDHTNTPHPNKSYGHNQGFWVDTTGKPNSFDSWMWNGLMYGSGQ